ncbi:XRE family transcriptional regulator [Actinoplanes hulinensis]|uniref:XRE family transcriptional regulator n=1 Tax=Actinoplanes hulinensis TaxID=1144547 RepID=A0ABS7BHC2_9ACTN|nr:XRE family transcriptional regulator [Actinoplanes hulinensis]MBW6440289.1 XRE family transcriptional regulator [Actinoplanes hulinensis]
MAKDLESALAAVGPRLRELRQRREITLTRLAETTGISVSTLSRLESGSRRPTLELLLPLAGAYQVTLDELVDAPETGDPRVRARPIQRGGHTYVPLSRRPGGLQAFKQILPPEPGACGVEQQTHEGYEWLYVLSGRVRLLLGDHDLVLTPGEAAEFDTRLPHAILNPGPEPAEVLNIFGPQGERVHVRARSTRGSGDDVAQ